MTGAVSACTSTVQVGTWVMSALHHNPGMIASAAETLDEICDGRFVLRLGAGHAGGGAREFGYPADRTVSRYAEALEIIVPLLRGDSVSFTGQFHRAQGAEVFPRGPRPGRIPLMLGGHAPRTMGLAARHADTWSAFATTSSLPETFRPITAQLDQICEDIGRDPASIGRSVGVMVEPGDAKVADALEFGVAITGSTNQIAETIAGFASVGVTKGRARSVPEHDRHTRAACPGANRSGLTPPSRAESPKPQCDSGVMHSRSAQIDGAYRPLTQLAEEPLHTDRRLCVLWPAVVAVRRRMVALVLSSVE